LPLFPEFKICSAFEEIPWMHFDWLAIALCASTVLVVLAVAAMFAA
jgi:hypothetical protein